MYIYPITHKTGTPIYEIHWETTWQLESTITECDSGQKNTNPRKNKKINTPSKPKDTVRLEIPEPHVLLYPHKPRPRHTSNLPIRTRTTSHTTHTHTHTYTHTHTRTHTHTHTHTHTRHYIDHTAQPYAQ